MYGVFITSCLPFYYTALWLVNNGYRNSILICFFFICSFSFSSVSNTSCIAGWRGSFTVREIRILTRPIVLLLKVAHHWPTIRRAPIGSGNRNRPLNQKTRNSSNPTGYGPRSVNQFRPVGYSFWAQK